MSLVEQLDFEWEGTDEEVAKVEQAADRSFRSGVCDRNVTKSTGCIGCNIGLPSRYRCRTFCQLKTVWLFGTHDICLRANNAFIVGVHLGLAQSATCD